MSQKKEGVLDERNKPGPALYAVTVRPDGDARAAIAVLHGYADHSARYARVQERWAEKGIASIAIDMRGHGKAEGPRGFCERFEEFLDDAGELEALVKRALPGVPAFLFGHSFGGLVAASVGVRGAGSYKGIMLSDPYFELALKVPAAKVLLGKVASRLVPKLAIPSGLGGSALTHDPEIARAYDEDPLVFKKATARWFTEATRAQAEALSGAAAMTTPLFVALGTQDSVASPNGGRRFFDRAGSKDKTKREFDGLYHELLMELEWKAVADALSDWALARV